MKQVFPRLESPHTPCFEFSLKPLVPSSSRRESALAKQLSSWNLLSFSRQLSLQYATFLHLQIDFKMFLLLHHSQTPILSSSPFLKVKAN